MLNALVGRNCEVKDLTRLDWEQWDRAWDVGLRPRNQNNELKECKKTAQSGGHSVDSMYDIEVKLYFVLIHVNTTLSADLRQRRQQPEQTRPELSPLLFFFPFSPAHCWCRWKKKKKKRLFKEQRLRRISAEPQWERRSTFHSLASGRHRSRAVSQCLRCAVVCCLILFSLQREDLKFRVRVSSSLF